MPIPARVSIVTLGVSDLERSKAFYEALGWEVMSSSVPGVITWFRTADTYLGLHDFEALAADANMPATSREGFGGVTLAINLESDEAVMTAVENALAAGGSLLKSPEQAVFGGLSPTSPTRTDIPGRWRTTRTSR